MRRIDNKFHIEGGSIFSKTGREVPIGRPLFLFDAADRLAAGVLRAYRSMCEADGCTPEHLHGVDEMIIEFEKFRHDHPELMKQPGSTRGK